MNTRLWKLSDEIQQLETAYALIADNETLSDEDREIKLEETFLEWLKAGESFKAKAELVARYIRHQEALAEARKAEARRIRTLAEQAENQANRLRRYLTNQMLLKGCQSHRWGIRQNRFAEETASRVIKYSSRRVTC